jgi:hypothetical protein
VPFGSKPTKPTLTAAKLDAVADAIGAQFLAARRRFRVSAIGNDVRNFRLSTKKTATLVASARDLRKFERWAFDVGRSAIGVGRKPNIERPTSNEEFDEPVLG